MGDVLDTVSSVAQLTSEILNGKNKVLNGENPWAFLLFVFIVSWLIVSVTSMYIVYSQLQLAISQQQETNSQLLLFKM